MERNVTMEEISDGRLYGLNDMVKADCRGCSGCSKCCTGMGASIILTPYDVWNIRKSMNCTFELLLAGKLELGFEGGVILPHIKMQEGRDCCGFLDENGRCSIHSFRPGVCRLFPLGRVYDKGSFSYFLQVRECPYPNKTKVKVRKWIDIEEIEQNTDFINKWHDFVKVVQNSAGLDEASLKQINMLILSEFFVREFGDDFYSEFESRRQSAKNILAKMGVGFEQYQ